MISFLKRERVFLFTIFLTLICVILLYPISIYLTNKSVDRRVEKLQNGIENDLQYSLSQAKEIVESKTLNQYIATDNRSALLPILDEERINRQLSTMVAVSKDGIAVARTPILSSYGDYIFQTQPWGRAAANGEATAMLGRGRTYPLVIIGAQPIIENNVVQGAVFAGYRMDDAYAVRFHNQYEFNQTQLIFYSQTDGVVGSSIQKTEEKNAVAHMFNAGSDWTQNKITDKYTIINNHSYFVKNISLANPDNPDDSVGGVILLIPLNFMHEVAIPALGIAILAFSIYWHFSKKQWIKKPKRRLLIAIMISILVFSVVFLINQKILNTKTLTIQKSLYTIYNSTLRLVPDSNVFNINNSQKIAIQISSGGEAINAVQTNILFDPEKVRVDDILITNSFCKSDMFLERIIDNNKGEVRIACFLLESGGFTKDKGTVAELLIQPLQLGNFSLHFSNDTQVLAHDGLGTNVLREQIDGSYQVINQSHTSQSLKDYHISVFSPTHPNPERWYNEKEIHLYWPKKAQTAYAYSLDDSPISTPGILQTTEMNTVKIKSPENGLYFFHIAPIIGSVIGHTTHYGIKIDTNPPSSANH